MLNVGWYGKVVLKSCAFCSRLIGKGQLCSFHMLCLKSSLLNYIRIIYLAKHTQTVECNWNIRSISRWVLQKRYNFGVCFISPCFASKKENILTFRVFVFNFRPTTIISSSLRGQVKRSRRLSSNAICLTSSTSRYQLFWKSFLS